MARETPAPESTIPRLLRLHAANDSSFAAPSLPTPFKLDEGYSDETRSQADKDLLLKSPANDVMNLPDWLLATSEAERAGKLLPLGAVRVSRSHTPRPRH